MTVVLVAVVAGTAAAGLLLMVGGAVGTVRSLDAAVADLHRPRRPGTDALAATSWLRRLAADSPPARQADLAILERDQTRWLQDRVKWSMLLGSLALSATVVIPMAAGRGLSPVPAVVAVLLGSAVGWFYAVIDLRADAEKARRELRHAVAAYLELVTILMAGGAGPESAMFMAVDIGRGRAFRHLRSALAASQVRQEPPWALFGEVGARLGVNELIELGASMTLAGGGAQVKDTLSAKAGSIRVSDLARIESEAQVRSETMALPVVMMFTGFLLLLGYPALAGLSGP